MNEADKRVFKDFGVWCLNWLVLIPGITLFFVGYYATAVWLVWNWYVPAVFGLPALAFNEAVGVSLLTVLLFKQSKRGDATSKEKLQEFLRPAILVLIAWVCLWVWPI